MEWIHSSDCALQILAAFWGFVDPYFQTFVKEIEILEQTRNADFQKKYRNRKEESSDNAVESDNVDDKLVSNSKPINSNNCLKIYQC